MLKIIDSISEWSGRIISYLFYPALIMLVCDVLMRYFFNVSFQWGQGIYQRLFAIYFVVGGAYVLLHNGHIRMDVLYIHLPIRTKAIIDIFSLLLMFSVVFVFIWWGTKYFWVSYTELEVDATSLKAVVYPVKFFIPISGALLALQGLAKLYRSISTLKNGRPI
jgi:TRAP-type mannitol/chloroaromatic compound transport system permease small subunit